MNNATEFASRAAALCSFLLLLTKRMDFAQQVANMARTMTHDGSFLEPPADNKDMSIMRAHVEKSAIEYTELMRSGKFDVDDDNDKFNGTACATALLERWHKELRDVTTH